MLSGGQIKIDRVCGVSGIKEDADKLAYCKEESAKVLNQVDDLCGKAYEGQLTNTAKCKVENKKSLWTKYQWGKKFGDKLAELGIETPKGKAAHLKEAIDKVVEASKTYAKAPEDPYTVIMATNIDADSKKKLDEAKALILEIVTKESDAAKRTEKREKLDKILSEALNKAIEESVKPGVDAVKYLNDYLKGSEFAKVLEEMSGGAVAVSSGNPPPEGLYVVAGSHLNILTDHYFDNSDGGKFYEKYRGVTGLGIRGLLGGIGFDGQVSYRFGPQKIIDKYFGPDARFSAGIQYKLDVKKLEPVLVGDKIDVQDGQGEHLASDGEVRAIEQSSKGDFVEHRVLGKAHLDWYAYDSYLETWRFAGAYVGAGGLFRSGPTQDFKVGSYELTPPLDSQFFILAAGARAGFELKSGNPFGGLIVTAEAGISWVPYNTDKTIEQSATLHQPTVDVNATLSVGFKLEPVINAIGDFFKKK